MKKEITFKVWLRWINHEGGIVIVSIRRNDEPVRQKFSIGVKIEDAEKVGEELIKELMNE